MEKFFLSYIHLSKNSNIYNPILNSQNRAARGSDIPSVRPQAIQSKIYRSFVLVGPLSNKNQGEELVAIDLSVADPLQAVEGTAVEDAGF